MLKKIVDIIKNIKWMVLTFLFFFLGINFVFGNVKEKNVVGKIEFEPPRYFALIKNTKTSEKNVYRRNEVIYFSNNNTDYFKIIDIKDDLIIGMDQKGNIVSLPGGSYLSNRNKLQFLKGIKVNKIRFSYIYGSYDDPKFTFSGFNNSSLWLSRNYKPTVNNYGFDKGLLKKVKVEKSDDSKVIIDKKSIQPLIEIGRKIIGDMIEKKKFNLEKEDKQQTLNLTLTNSAAEIVVGSSGILVKRFFLKKLPDRIDLQKGDFIKRINKKPINSLRDICYILKNLAQKKGPTTVEVDLIRDYKIKTKYYKIR